MKTLFLGISLLAASAWAEPFTLTGTTSQGEPCDLTVLEWGYEGNGEELLQNLYVTVSTSWQLSESSPIKTKASATPYALFGEHKTGIRDAIALELAWGSVDPKTIKSFIFETPTPNGLFQSSCRIKNEPES